MLTTKKRNFKETTKALFLKYTVIPILVIMILFSLFTIFIFKIKIIYDTSQSANHIEAAVMDVYQDYVQEIERMSQLPVVLDNINTKRNNHLVYEEFYNFNNRQTVKSVFHLVDNRNVLLASTTDSKSEVNEEILHSIIPSIQKNPNELLIEAKQTHYSHGKVTVFNVGKAIIEEQQIIGYMIYQLYEEDLQRLIFGEEVDIVVITDQYDQIIITSNRIVKGLMNKFSPEKISNSQVRIKDDIYYLKEIQTPNQLFTIYTLKNIKTGNLIIVLYTIFIVVTSVMLYFLLRNLAEKMSSKNVQSIDKLVTAVAHLERGDLTSYVRIDTGDEFEVLANQYNSMLDHLNQLISTNKELSAIRRTNEIKLLQSQFNPHFLFNVLETLRYTMYVDLDQAQEIIYSLSRLLRYSINNDERHVSFEQDLDYILDYLKLHKLRFTGRLEYDIDIQDEVKDAYVPRLLLQPLIENAIKYGYSQQTHLQINIRGEIVGDEIIFTVADNGSGITSEKLDDIRTRLYSTNKLNKNKGIGLYNTHRRIVLPFGEKYGVTIDSLTGKGTRIMIKIPHNRGADVDV
ncbi:sensor histidine kinase [Sporosarcina sp. YIM B06819]|uniref:sensor histidine kinase n=1 Tax=Sporosarcina sp. YIM B06819 TaxID=3081769 RepID=UPI00298BFF95|nr:histidine kinase [Sporosarcina sp. YIM B06819]